VLFCDVVGFTPLSESRDPEAVRELLSRYFEVARTVIGRYGGMVEKFIGDAVMAVWGTPVATEGDPERAVRAALDLVSAVRQLGAEVGVPDLAARAGVVTGAGAVGRRARIGTGGRRDATPGEQRDRVCRRRFPTAEGQGRAAGAVAGDPGAGRGGWRPADRRPGGTADRAGRGAAHGQGTVPCRRRTQG